MILSLLGFLPYGGILDIGKGLFRFDVPRIIGNITLFGQIHKDPRLFVS